MLAAILVVLVIAELAISVWCLTRFNAVREEMRMIERHQETISDMIRNWTSGQGEEPIELDAKTIGAANDVLESATDEQLEQAAEILKKLGLGEKV